MPAIDFCDSTFIIGEGTGGTWSRSTWPGTACRATTRAGLLRSPLREPLGVPVQA